MSKHKCATGMHAYAENRQGTGIWCANCGDVQMFGDAPCTVPHYISTPCYRPHYPYTAPYRWYESQPTIWNTTGSISVGTTATDFGDQATWTAENGLLSD